MTQQSQSNQAEAAEAAEQAIPEVNAFMLTGDVEEITDGRLLMVTKQTSPRTGETYADRHAILLDESTNVDSKVSAKTKKVTVYGFFDKLKLADRNVTVLHASAVLPAKADSPYINVGRWVGEVARSYEFFPSIAPAPGQPAKTAFGNLLVRVGSFFGMATGFSFAAQKLRNVTPGSTVKAEGRIDYRQGDKAIRLILNPEQTNILKLKEIDDPLAAHPGVVTAAATASASGDDIPF